MTLRELITTLFPSNLIRDDGNGELAINCPFCIEEVGKRDFKQRLGINTTTGVGHCFRCEKKAAAGVIGKRYWFKELNRAFNASYTLDKEIDEAPIVEEVVKEKLKEVILKLPSEYEPLWKNVDDRIGKKALKYLTSRNITSDQIKKHRIGFCAVGKYAYRIIFPVVYKEKLVGIVTRDFSGKAEYKYLNSKGDKTLFGVPKNIAREAHLSEGIFDALALERGVDPSEDCLATLGGGLTKQVQKILKRYRVITIWPDPDRPGIEGAIKKAKQLVKKNITVKMVLPDSNDEEGDDLGSMHWEEIEERSKGAVLFSKAVASRLRLRIASIVPPKQKKPWKRPEPKS